MILAAGSPFDPIYNFFGTILAFFYGIIPNLGVSIILLTVLIKIVFFPLSAASYKSMAKMKLITPRLTKIREMYAQDRQKIADCNHDLHVLEQTLKG